MSQGLNRVMLLGHLGQDGELKVTQGGQAVLKLRMAMTESYLDRNNERQEKTEWATCTVWGKRAEALSQYTTKGKQIFVEGSLHTSSYEKNGEKRYSTEINVREIILCGGGSGNAGTAPGSGSREGAQQRSFAGGGSGGGGSRTRQVPADQGFGTGGGSAGFDDFAGDSGGDDSEIPFALNMTMTRRLVP
jgi:single-strand DNA-binding protein